MHPAILPPFAAAALLIACSGAKNNPKTTADRTPVPVLVPTIKYGGPGRGDSLFLSLERTPCFGHCRAYRIHLYRSGHATYQGVVNVEKLGPHEARIGKDTLDLLLRKAEELNFFTLENEYDGPVTDLPSTIVRVVGNGKDKTVTGRVRPPERFNAFVAYAEELLLPVAWRPVKPRD